MLSTVETHHVDRCYGAQDTPPSEEITLLERSENIRCAIQAQNVTETIHIQESYNCRSNNPHAIGDALVKVGVVFLGVTFLSLFGLMISYSIGFFPARNNN